MNKHIMAAALAITLLASSCSTTKNDISYFTNIGTSESGAITPGSYEIKIIPDDELIITVSSLVPEATAVYNTPMANVATRNTTTPTTVGSLLTYVVDQNGDIMMPILGKLHVSGLTTKEISSMITKEVEKTVKDPYVRVQLLNFRINVLGEVNSPGVQTIGTERYTIMDAIAASGDLTIYGQRNNILLIREENGQNTYHRLNLNDVNILSSPYYYLQQNDVIYVEPNKIRKDNSKFNSNNNYKLSVISTCVSAAAVVSSMVIALCIK